MSLELVERLENVTLKEFNKEFKQQLWKEIISRHEEPEPVIDEALRLHRKGVGGFIDACLGSKSRLALDNMDDFTTKVGKPKCLGGPDAVGYYSGAEGSLSWLGLLDRYWFHDHLTFELPYNEVMDQAEAGIFRLGLSEIAELSSKWDVSDSYSDYAIECGCSLPVLEKK